MTRRLFLLGTSLSPLAMAWGKKRLLADSSKVGCFSTNPSEVFICYWNAFVARTRAAHSGTLDAQAFELWQKAKTSWKTLEQMIDRWYRGK